MYIDQIMVATNGEKKVLIIVSSYHKKYLVAGEDQEKMDYLEDVLNEKVVPETLPAEGFVVDEIDYEGNISGYAIVRDTQVRMSLYDGVVATKVCNVPMKIEPHMVEFTVDLEKKSFDA